MASGQCRSATGSLRAVLRNGIVGAANAAVLVVALVTAAGCEGNPRSRDGMRIRVYPGADYDDTFRAVGRALNDQYGGLILSDRIEGRIDTANRKYNPAALGPVEMGRFTGPGDYRSHAEAVIERVPEGTRVHMRVVVERYEAVRRMAAAGINPNADGFYDDRRPNTPLQEALYSGGSPQSHWLLYRTDRPMAETLLLDVERLLNPPAAQPAKPARPEGAGPAVVPGPVGPTDPAKPAPTPTDKPSPAGGPPAPGDKPAPAAGEK